MNLADCICAYHGYAVCVGTIDAESLGCGRTCEKALRQGAIRKIDTKCKDFADKLANSCVAGHKKFDKIIDATLDEHHIIGTKGLLVYFGSSHEECRKTESNSITGKG